MLYQLSYARAPSGGGRIRTLVGCRRQIYSLLPLATRAPPHAGRRAPRSPPPIPDPTDNAPRVSHGAGCVGSSGLETRGGPTPLRQRELTKGLEPLAC